MGDGKTCPRDHTQLPGAYDNKKWVDLYAAKQKEAGDVLK